MNQVAIGVGSNIRPRENIARAIERIGSEHRLLGRSRFVFTRPIGTKEQPDFLNGSILIETSMNHAELKRWLKDLEQEIGREKGVDKYGPRPIDLDVLVWNGKIIHQDVSERGFLKKAILEILPELKIKL
jgi:2-amino-4-hydroxy-6-hydroxymethyldihydropteridine diphosphokinase